MVVCTANRCRSPLAAALLERAADARGVSAHIETAGLHEAGFPATTDALTVAARRGLDLAPHRSRKLSPTLVTDAELLIAMERRHVRRIVTRDPTAWPRTFTLKELVRRGEAIGARAPDESIEHWLGRVQAGRESRELLGASVVDDVADPSGSPIGEHEDLVQELTDLMDRLAELLWPPLSVIAWSAR